MAQVNMFSVAVQDFNGLMGELLYFQFLVKSFVVINIAKNFQIMECLFVVCFMHLQVEAF